MYTIFIGTAAVTALFAIFACFGKFPEEDTRLTFIRRHAVIGGIIGLFVSSFVAGKFVRESIPLQEIAIGTINLAAMRSQEATAGTFLFGTGSVMQHKVYQFYVRHADGSVSPSQLEADETTRIMEDPSLKNEGTLTIYERQRDPNSKRNAWAIAQSQDKHITRRVFRVPVGTVLVSFQVN